jgi:hypothetical protein
MLDDMVHVMPRHRSIYGFHFFRSMGRISGSAQHFQGTGILKALVSWGFVKSTKASEHLATQNRPPGTPPFRSR